MKRRLFNILAAVSLVLLLLAAVAAVRGIWIRDVVFMRWHDKEYGLGSEGGVLGVILISDTFGAQSGGPFFRYVRGQSLGYAGTWEALSKSEYHTVAQSGYAILNSKTLVIFAPAWLACIMFAIVPALWLRRHLRQRRQAMRGFAVEQVAEPEAANEAAT